MTFFSLSCTPKAKISCRKKSENDDFSKIIQTLNLESFYNLLIHLVFFITVSSCCFHNLVETQRGRGTANSWWILWCLLAGIRPGKKIGQVRKSLWYQQKDWNVLIILCNIIKVMTTALSTLKALCDIKHMHT